MTRSRRTFTVRFETLDDGTWVVDVIEEPDVHGRGQTLAAAETSVRAALVRALGVEEHVKVAPGDLILEPRFTFPEADMVGRVRRQREVARRADADAEELATDAARELVKGRKMSLRDTAYLLGVTPRRIGQMLGTRTPRAAT